MSIKIDLASPEQIDALRKLTRQLVEGLGQEFDHKRFDWGISRRIYDKLQRHGILIAIDEDKDDEVIGMIVAELRIDPFGTSEGYIKQVFLKEDYRGKGIGELLIKKAIEHLQKISAYLTTISQQIKELVIPELKSFRIDTDALEKSLEDVRGNLTKRLAEHREEKEEVVETVEDTPPQEKKPDWTSIDWGKRKR